MKKILLTLVALVAFSSGAQSQSLLNSLKKKGKQKVTNMILGKKGDEVINKLNQKVDDVEQGIDRKLGLENKEGSAVAQPYFGGVKESSLMQQDATPELDQPAIADEDPDYQWVNITPLSFTAAGETDRQKTLQQYLLIKNEAYVQNPEVFKQYEVFTGEYVQKTINAAAPQVEKEIEESIAAIKKAMKEHPELAAQMKDGLKELEASRGKMTAEYVKEIGDYTYAPADLQKALTKIAVNKRAYSGYRIIRQGLFAVQDGPSYGPVDYDAFNRAKAPEGQEFTWGVMKSDGTVVIPFKYSEVWKTDEGKIWMVRSDDKLDVYDANFNLTATEEKPEPEPDGIGKY